MSPRWLPRAIPSAAAAALLVAVAACSSPSSEPAAADITDDDSPSGWCSESDDPMAMEACEASASPAIAHRAHDAPATGSCPYSGATGKSDLSLEEVLRRVHEKEGSSCPYLQRSKSAESPCPYLEKYGQDAPREASTFL